MKVGDHVRIKAKHLEGIVRFVGNTHFASGKWIGIELSTPEGKNNGTVKGESYFECAENHGMFVRQTQAEVIKKAASKPASTKTSPAKASKPSSKTSSKSGSTTSLNSTKTRKGSDSSSTAAEAPPQATAIPEPVAEAQSAPAAAPAPTPAAEPRSIPAPTPAVQRPAPVATTTATAPPAAAATHVPQSVPVVKATRTVSQEDPARARELEMLRMQVAQMSEYKSQWQQKQEDLNHQLNQTMRREQELKEQLDSELIVATQLAENAMLDKQLAEEQCQLLQETNDDLADQVEELTLKMELLKAEASVGGGIVNADGAGNDGSNRDQTMESATIEALKSKVQRLTEVLVHLRGQNQLLTKENNDLKGVCSDLQAENKAMAHVLELKEQALSKTQTDLSSQLERADAGADAEQLLEQLTQQNLALEDRCTALEEEIRDLREMAVVEDETVEVIREVEGIAQEDTLELSTQVEKLYGALQELATRYAEQQNVVNKYKQKVLSLEGDLSEAAVMEQDQIEKGLAEKDFQVQSLSHKLADSNIRERLKTVELALHKLEAEQSSQHIDLLKSFLAEDFFRNDYNGLQLLLLLTRLQSKAGIIRTQVVDEFKADDDLDRVVSEDSELTIEQFCWGQNCLEALDTVTVLSAYMEDTLKHVSVEEYSRIGEVYAELAAHEAALDGLLRQIRGDGLSPHVALQPLYDAVKALHRLCDLHLKPNYPRPDAENLHDSATIISGASKAIMAQLHRLDNLYQPSLSQDSAFGPVMSRMSDSAIVTRSLQSNAGKILRALPDASATTTVKLSEEQLNQLEQFAFDLHHLATSLANTCQETYDHIHGSVTLRSLDLDTALGIAVNSRVDMSDDGSARAKAAEDGAEEAMLPLVLKDLIKQAGDKVSDIAAQMLEGNFDVPKEQKKTATNAPWEVRATNMRRAVTETLDLPQQLEAAQESIKELKSESKLKDRELREKETMLAAVNKRVDSVRHMCEQQLKEKDAAMHEVEEGHKRSNEALNSVLEELQSDLERLTKERDEYKKKVSAIGGRRLGSRVINSGGDGASSADLRAAGLQIELLAQALSDARAELAKSQAKGLREDLTLLPSLAVCKPLPPRMASAGKLVKSAGELNGQLLKAAASLSVVDVSKPLAERKQAPRAVLANAVAKIKSLQQRSLRLKDELGPALAKATGQKDDFFGSSVTPDYQRVLRERGKEQVVGKLTLPSVTARGHRIHVGPAELRQIHQTLA
eukprot:TRINITY_DN10533_c0_g1_i3.p1 TRINITY_DN10533_c0_g1~~TRINITY_DN10533_c0_g1_i3.p1  ORF type:complete len:1234 (+),score=447.48 TRINITY_DN10533_c0_g1_i3:1086-4787(+)